jgi:hypothetical protein
LRVPFPALHEPHHLGLKPGGCHEHLIILLNYSMSPQRIVPGRANRWPRCRRQPGTGRFRPGWDGELLSDHTGAVTQSILLPLQLFYPPMTIDARTRPVVCASPCPLQSATGVVALLTGQGPASAAPCWHRPRGGWRPRRRPKGPKCRLMNPTHPSVAPIH